MKRLINGQKVDISKCTQILYVDAHIGRRTLLKTKAGNFLTLEQTLSEFPPEIVRSFRVSANPPGNNHPGSLLANFENPFQYSS